MTSGVNQEETYSFIILGVLLKYRSTNFTLVKATFACNEQISNVTPKGFFTYILTSKRLLEDLDIIVTKEESHNTDTPNGFTTDTEQKCSNNNSTLVTALKEHINSLKGQLRNKRFIMESLIPNLQHRYHATIVSSRNQILGKMHRKYRFGQSRCR